MAETSHPRRTCRACKAPVLILKDFKGREHHLDPTAPVFTVQKDLTGDTIVTRAEAYVSHFSTCPKALEANRSTS